MTKKNDLEKKGRSGDGRYRSKKNDLEKTVEVEMGGIDPPSSYKQR
jgi:hypothetical protein